MSTRCPHCGELKASDDPKQLCWVCLIDYQNSMVPEFNQAMAHFEFDDTVEEPDDYQLAG